MDGLEFDPLRGYSDTSVALLFSVGNAHAIVSYHARKANGTWPLWLVPVPAVPMVNCFVQPNWLDPVDEQGRRREPVDPLHPVERRGSDES